MEQFVIERDGDRNISFTGELIASAASSPNQAMGSAYIGSTGIWQNLILYRTKSGTFVCQRVNFTQWQGERTQFEAAICEDHDQIVEFFGGGWLAKKLYDEADIDAFFALLR